MSEQKHTQEPWIYFPARHEWHTGEKAIFDDGVWYIHPADDVERLPICIIDKGNDHHEPTRKQAEVDARRIVACINACEGIPTDGLEAHANKGGMIGAAIETVADYKQQRDELLASMKRIAERCPADSPIYAIASVGDGARLAIAKVESK